MLFEGWVWSFVGLPLHTHARTKKGELVYRSRDVRSDLLPVENRGKFLCWTQAVARTMPSITSLSLENNAPSSSSSSWHVTAVSDRTQKYIEYIYLLHTESDREKSHRWAFQWERRLPPPTPPSIPPRFFLHPSLLPCFRNLGEAYTDTRWLCFFFLFVIYIYFFAFCAYSLTCFIWPPLTLRADQLGEIILSGSGGAKCCTASAFWEYKYGRPPPHFLSPQAR